MPRDEDEFDQYGLGPEAISASAIKSFGNDRAPIDIWRSFADRYHADRSSYEHQAVFQATSEATVALNREIIKREIKAEPETIKTIKKIEGRLTRLLESLDVAGGAGSGLAVSQLPVQIRLALERSVISGSPAQLIEDNPLDRQMKATATVRRQLNSLLDLEAVLREAGKMPAASSRGQNSHNRIFLDAIGHHINELAPVLRSEKQPTYSYDEGSGSLRGWLPDFLRDAETHAIEQNVGHMSRALSISSMRRICERMGKKLD